MSDAGVFVPVSAVFPGIQADIATFVELLRTLSRTDVVFWCARLNLVVTTATDQPYLNRQAFGVNQFFTRDETQLIDRFAQNHKGEVTVFFRGSLLEIVRWAVLVCVDHRMMGQFSRIRMFVEPLRRLDSLRATFGGAASTAKLSVSKMASKQHENVPLDHSGKDWRGEW